jgi:membrane dipeptidase
MDAMLGYRHDARRRRLLKAAAALLAAGPLAARGQARVPIADMHSHYGMITRRSGESGLADDMRKNGVVLVAWKLVADARWIRSGSGGIVQSAEPEPGELAKFFDAYFERMRGYAGEHKLRTVLTSADVDACVAGEPGIVLAAEGADFLEGKLDGLAAAYEKGLRHLQLVHYIRTPVGDRQTERPTHNGLSEFGRRLIEACNERGILVDLAHSSAEALDQALVLAKAPLVWSHSWVDEQGGQWRDASGFLQRRLSLAQAKKIAAQGGVVGLWGLGLQRPAADWPVGWEDRKGYARELAKLADKLGADHVAIGTDIEGVGRNWTVNDYGHVRAVVDMLQAMRLPDSVVERIAYANYARVLKAALKG